MMNANNGSMYKLFVPKQAVGANLIYFDLFNATDSGMNLYVYSVLPVVSGAVAVTGVLGVDLFLNRTSAVGTGGTAATLEGTSFTAATISGFDATNSVLSPKITARLTPSGGATAGAVLSMASVFTEETAAPVYNGTVYEMWAKYGDIHPIKVRENTGISVVQGAIASVGNIGFEVVFQVVPKALALQ